MNYHHPRRHDWMLFVDGENFAMRAAGVAARNGLTLTEGAYYKKDVFLWFPKHLPTQSFAGSYHPDLEPHATRSTYYTSTSDSQIQSTREALWALGFSPEVFKRSRTRGSKGVDIALTKDMLSHAHLGNYDTAVLITADADYVPVVEEVKRLGKRVIVWFFEEEINDALRTSADRFRDLTTILIGNCKSGVWDRTPPRI